MSKEVETKMDEKTEQRDLQGNEPTNQQERLNEQSHWLVQTKKKIDKDFKKYLTITIVSVVIGFVLNALWVAPLVATHHKKITHTENTIKHCDDSHITINLQELNQTVMARLEEYDKSLKEMRKNLSEKEIFLERAESRIEEYENEIRVLRETLNETQKQYEVLVERLQEKEELLEQVLARAESFERDHNTTIDRVSTLESSHEQLVMDLNSTELEIAATIQDLQENITETSKETAALQLKLRDIKTDTNSINDSKVSFEVFEEQLRHKVDVSEFEALTANLSSLEETSFRADNETRAKLRDIENDIAALNRTKADLDTVNHQLHELDIEKVNRQEFVLLQANVSSLEESSSTADEEINRKLRDVEEEISFLNSTKADWETVHHQLHELERGKVDRNEYKLLSANVSSLEETSSRTDSEIRNELRTLSSNTQNNITLLDDIKADENIVQNLIDQLNSSKVDMTAFEILSQSVTSLNDTSMREDENIRQDLHELVLTAQINYTQLYRELALKASRSDLQNLSDTTVRSISFNNTIRRIDTTINQLQSNTTLTYNTFNITLQQMSNTLSTKATKQDLSALTTRVTTVETSKVDKSTYNSLATRVKTLEDGKASASDLSSLDTRVGTLENTRATKTSLDIVKSDVRHNEEQIRNLENSGMGVCGSWIIVTLSVTFTATVTFKFF